MQLVPPHEVPKRLRVEPWLLRNLLYDMAVVFGAISLEHKEEVITILGEWRGKTSRDYTNEKVKVMIQNDERHQSVKDELSICRELCSGLG